MIETHWPYFGERASLGEEQGALGGGQGEGGLSTQREEGAWMERDLGPVQGGKMGLDEV